MSRGRKLLRRVLLALVLTLVVLAGTSWLLLRTLQRSLPQLTGTAVVDGLAAVVTVDRDSLGVPTITASSTPDAMRALGFLHAQDRFFQMDLQRRQAAGELVALVGGRAAVLDDSSRRHRFRHIAREALARATPTYREVLEAYAEGVNAGLATLGAAPPEYLVLRATPQPWAAEDAILTVLTMFNTLQGRQPQFEATFGTLHDTLPRQLFDFLTARGSTWDAPLAGDAFPRPPIPDRTVVDLRATLAVDENSQPLVNAREASPCAAGALDARLIFADHAGCLAAEEAAIIGSNNWAVAGSHTATGAALVANDMHLGINVPNLWYRAVVRMPDERTPGQTLRLVGVTLPGMPGVVVGSNGHIAWGFTNTGGDWSDLVIVEPDPRDSGRYLTPDGSRAFEEHDGGAGAKLRWTIWGPIIGRDHRGRELAQHWVAHDPDVLARDTMAPAAARTIDEALVAANSLGIPAQNFVAADRAGRIGWTIAGPVPKRIGFDGSRPTSWADGSHRWDGYLPIASVPRILDPVSGRLWTANAPVVNDERLAVIGEGGYADGIRARLIRDRLLATDKATVADMLSVQLNDDALFHDRWRTLVLNTLTPDAIGNSPRRALFRELVERTWTGRADPSSVAYRLVRTFRAALSRDVFASLTAAARRADPEFDFTRALRSEGPLWQLVSARPLHLLDPQYQSWDAQIVAAIDKAIEELTAGGASLRDQSWGAFNRAVVTHPLGAALPVGGAWLNMPADPLPGDIYTPRAHSPRAGPSERMVVSPGREEEGILHMPTGQSGHPLSPHYRDQHDAWIAGKAVPLLPGPASSRLTLVGK
jgi:penicillin G amidase